MAIYRNTPENDRRFMAENSAGFTYQDVFSGPEFMNFEEVAPGSIGEIWRNNGWTTGEIGGGMVDLHAYSWDFRISWGYGSDHHETCDDRSLVFE